MADTVETPDIDDDRFWPKFVAALTADVREAGREQDGNNMAVWQSMRRQAVHTWADQETAAARFPGGSQRRGRLGR